MGGFHPTQGAFHGAVVQWCRCARGWSADFVQRWQLSDPGQPDRALHRGRRHRTRHLESFGAGIQRRREKAYKGKRRVAWYEVFAGEKAKAKFDTWLPDDTVDAVREFRVAIKGPLTTPVGGGIRSLNVALRQILDLYSCVRPAKYYKGVPSPVKHPERMDVVIYRENTEDVYAGIE